VPLRRFAALAALLALACLAACERAPDVAEPQVYATAPLTFRLPGNWSVTRDEHSVEDGGEFRNVVVESPGNAIVLVQLYTPVVDVSAEAFSAELMAATVAEVEGMLEIKGMKPLSASGGTPSAVQATVAGELRDGVERNFVIRVLGQPVPHRARTFRVASESWVVFLVLQAATEDWARVAPGFDLISSSLALQ
jgi:hypothetical protein